MRILIIEDEPIIARRIKRLVQTSLGDQLESITIQNSVENGIQFLQQTSIDLLLLDLNLHGEDGFEVLEAFVAAPFYIIIISAYQEKAIRAFEYGVLDFVPKPFNQERIAKALLRVSAVGKKVENQTRFLAVQKRGRHELLEIENLLYIKGAGVYSELYFENGSKEIHNKNLDKLDRLLPAKFDRIHKSYIVNNSRINSIRVQSGGKYTVEMTNATTLPISRARYKALREKWAL